LGLRAETQVCHRDGEDDVPAVRRRWAHLTLIEEQVRRKGIKPVTSIHELAGNGFESDDELEKFLVDLYEFRHSNMA
jgi:hypothetical protein